MADVPSTDPAIEDARRDLIVTYGTRSEGQKGYILLNRSNQSVAFTSDFKSEVIEQAQIRKGFEPVNGSEETYSRQIAAVAGEAPMTELSDLRLALTRATTSALTEYLVNMAGQDVPDGQEALDNYAFSVEQRGQSAVVVEANNIDGTRAFTFTLNVSGALARLAETNVTPIQ